MTKTMRIETVEFQREQDSPIELGVMINEGDGPIIDMDGKMVPEGGLWHYHLRSIHVMTVTEER